jgi:hypothetical protein
MLREIMIVRQVPGDFRRRWFQDDYFDLYVWYAESGDVAGFQLCYDRQGDEHAFTCMAGSPPKHQSVDAPGSICAVGPTPLLTPARRSLPREVVSRFTAASSGLDAGIRKWILQSLEDAQRGAAD